MKYDHLPRQARDKHDEKSRGKGVLALQVICWSLALAFPLLRSLMITSWMH